MNQGKQTVRGAGYIYWQRMLGDHRIRHVQDSHALLLETFEQFAKECLLYHNHVDELPFTYRERQLNGLLLPALAKAADVAFPEQPIQRGKKAKKTTHGWVDYWVLKDDFVFLIELKHDYITLPVSIFAETNVKTLHSTDLQLTKSCREEWATALKQIKNISKTEAQDFVHSHRDNAVAKIALQIMPLQATSSRWTKLVAEQPPSDDLKAEFDYEQHHGKHLSPQAADWLLKNVGAALHDKPHKAPNWLAVWQLHNDFQTIEQWDDKSFGLFPGVVLAAKVEFPLLD